MLILAKTIEGKEYFYNARSARAVSKKSAQTIRDIANDNNYQLRPGEKWHIYEIDKYDIAFDYAQLQAFKIRNGIVRDYRGI